MRRLLLYVVLLFACGTARSTGAEGTSAVEAPPPPQMQDTTGMSQQEAMRAAEEWSRALGKWMASTTPQQRAALREREGRLPEPGDAYSWKTAARAVGLTETDLGRLEVQKLLIGKHQFRQSFEPYIAHTLPVFVTSDSLLNAFHVLFEDSFRELEIRRQPRLKQHLEDVFARVTAMLAAPRYPRSDLEPGWLQAQRVVGPAMVLLGTPLDEFEAGVRGEIAAQVAKIRDANTVELPAWLAPASPTLEAIDYRRMKPVGFYAENARMADYFRAVRWLQLVPFRVDRDNELTAIALLGFGARQGNPGGLDDFFTSYQTFLGPIDGNAIGDAEMLDLAWDLTRDGGAKVWSDALASQRRNLPARRERINDEFRLRPISADGPETPAFRVLAANGLPDAELFQNLGDQGESLTGLMVASLAGSNWAESKLTPKNPKEVGAALKAWRADIRFAYDRLPSDVPVYIDYMHLLGGLFAPPDPDAPPFVGGDAWAAKSCQTALAGWTQMRHTFTLQAKLTTMTLGSWTQPPGFIEPNPEFFRRFVDFVERTRDKLEMADIFSNTAERAAIDLEERAEMLDQISAKIATAADYRKLPEIRDFERFLGYDDLLYQLPDGGPYYRRTVGLVTSTYDRNALAELLPKYSAFLRSLARRYRSGEIQPVEPGNLTRMRSLAKRWQRLEKTSSRLEELLQKQLRGRPWTKEENHFIKDFGSSIAMVMAYFGNSFEQPRDDAPRWVEIVDDPQGSNSLDAAIGRPQAIYVLYPWNGMEIFSEGSVMPYYELRSGGRLTDREWRGRLDEKQAPAQPSWIQVDTVTQ